MCVRWGNSLSDPFHVNNGVRQEVFYLLIYAMCIMDDLSQSLNCCKTGCLSDEIIINHLMYADDLVLLWPSATGAIVGQPKAIFTHNPKISDIVLLLPPNQTFLTFHYLSVLCHISMVFWPVIHPFGST